MKPGARKLIRDLQAVEPQTDETRELVAGLKKLHPSGAKLSTRKAMQGRGVPWLRVYPGIFPLIIPYGEDKERLDDVVSLDNTGNVKIRDGDALYFEDAEAKGRERWKPWLRPGEDPIYFAKSYVPLVPTETFLWPVRIGEEVELPTGSRDDVTDELLVHTKEDGPAFLGKFTMADDLRYEHAAESVYVGSFENITILMASTWVQMLYDQRDADTPLPSPYEWITKHSSSQYFPDEPPFKHGRNPFQYWKIRDNPTFKKVFLAFPKGTANMVADEQRVSDLRIEALLKWLAQETSLPIGGDESAEDRRRTAVAAMKSLETPKNTVKAKAEAVRILRSIQVSIKSGGDFQILPLRQMREETCVQIMVSPRVKAEIDVLAIALLSFVTLKARRVRFDDELGGTTTVQESKEVLCGMVKFFEGRPNAYHVILSIQLYLVHYAQ